MSETSRWRRFVPGRPARMIVAVALGAALVGGATGGVLGGLGAAASGHAGFEHSEHGRGLPGAPFQDDH